MQEIYKIQDCISGEEAAKINDHLMMDGIITLEHDERYIRRRQLYCDHGLAVLVDFKVTTELQDGDLLVTECGKYFKIHAKKEFVYRITAQNSLHLLELAWHIGNRHLAVEISKQFLVIKSDPVIKTMLEGLGANIIEEVAPFKPLRGAYSHDHENKAHEDD